MEGSCNYLEASSSRSCCVNGCAACYVTAAAAVFFGAAAVFSL